MHSLSLLWNGEEGMDRIRRKVEVDYFFLFTMMTVGIKYGIFVWFGVGVNKLLWCNLFRNLWEREREILIVTSTIFPSLCNLFSWYCSRKIVRRLIVKKSERMTLIFDLFKSWHGYLVSGGIIYAILILMLFFVWILLSCGWI